MVLVNVTDNGIGLDEAKADMVFRPLGRLHQNDQYGGSGLGLSICRKIVRRHGGELSYRSTPGFRGDLHRFAPRRLTQRPPKLTRQAGEGRGG